MTLTTNRLEFRLIIKIYIQHKRELQIKLIAKIQKKIDNILKILLNFKFYLVFCAIVQFQLQLSNNNIYTING